MSAGGWGLTVRRETDVLALTAFLLSFAALLYQARDFLRGSEMRLFPPEQILIVRNGQYQTPYISATLAYVNQGAAGYGALVRGEKVRFSIGGKDYEQQWQQFVTFDVNKNNELIPGSPQDAAPFLIPGAGAASHNTLFAPRTIRDRAQRFRNFVNWDAFLDALAKEEQLTMEFRAVVAGEEEELTQRVVIDVSPDLIKTLRTAGFAAPSCWPATAR